MSSLSNDERRWNRLCDTMRSFHDSFKQEFVMIYDLADGSYNKLGWSLHMYLDAAKRLKSGLTMHHTIEERHVFPKLAKRMPAFADTPDGPHWNSHREIHEGLDKMSQLIVNFSEDPTSYSPAEIRSCMDGFREVLFRHLDEEVEDLRGANLKKYFTLEEVEQLMPS